MSLNHLTTKRHLKRYYYVNILLYYSIYYMLSFVYFRLRITKNLIAFWLFHKILKEMFICISMSIIKKVFYYEETELPVIKYKNEIWFRGKTVAEILAYAIQRKGA